MALDLFRVSSGLQIDDSTQILEGSGAPSLDAPIGSIYTETTTGGLYTKIAAGAGADKWSVLSTVAYVDQEIHNVSQLVSGLGNAFNYVGTVAGGVSGSGLDLATLPTGGKDAGDYYKVTTAGYFKIGAGAEFYANVGDGLVWNLSGGVDKIDNTDSTVAGTTNYISVAGSTDTGYTVDIATAFKNRMTNAEGSIISLTTRMGNAETAIGSLNTAVGNLQTDVGNLQTDVGNLQTEDGYVRAFIGKAAGNDMPNYTSTTQITQGTSLEAAISELDLSLGGNVTTNSLVTSSSSANANIQSIANFVEASNKETNGTAVTTLSDTVSSPMAKWIVYLSSVADATKVTAYEVFAASNGTVTDYNRSGILRTNGGVPGATVVVTQSGANMVITATSTGNSNITIKRVAAI